MILEVDCGNSRIKWQVVYGEPQQLLSAGTALDKKQLLTQLREASVRGLVKARVVSVRAGVETDNLVAALKLEYSVPVSLAHATKTLCGVSNGYLEPDLLGVDRWLAIVAAYTLTGAACLVLDLGTAVTADFVRQDGMHLGGFICPGLGLMREQLGGGTELVGYVTRAGMAGEQPGRKTAEAVERGTELMLIGFIGTQIRMAYDLLVGDCSIILTGGDASLAGNFFNQAVVIPDLVFRGLALACPN